MSINMQSLHARNPHKPHKRKRSVETANPCGMSNGEFSIESLLSGGQTIRPFPHIKCDVNSRLINPPFTDWPTSIPHPSVFFPLPAPTETVSQSELGLRHRAFVENVIMAKLKGTESRSNRGPSPSRTGSPNLEPVMVTEVPSISDSALLQPNRISPAPSPESQSLVECENSARRKADSCSHDLRSFRTDGNEFRQLQYKWGKNSSKHTDMRIPEAIVQEYKHRSQDSSPLRNISFKQGLALIMHFFLLDESLWHPWANISTKLDDEHWRSDRCRLVRKFPILNQREMLRFRNSHGVYHTYRVMLPALLWAMHDGFPPLDIPPKH